MSALSEYLALIPGGLKNIGNVVEGLRNQIKMEYGNIPQEDSDEIVRRRLICNDCPFMSKNAVKNGTYFTKRVDEHCTMCGCPLDTRTASLHAPCGIDTYNQKNPNNQLPLKWDKFK